MSRRGASSGGPGAWREASQALARRVTRRARTEAALQPLSKAVAAGAVLAALGRITGHLPSEPLWVVVVPLVAVLAFVPRALRAYRAAPLTSPGAAAWALDRLAGAAERGLTAAVASGPAASEAALAAPALCPPPVVALEPPRGAAVLIAGLLLAAGAALLPTTTTPDLVPQLTQTEREEADAALRTSEAGARASEAQAQRLAAQARRGESVREELGLSPQGPLATAEVARRLEDPAHRSILERLAQTLGEAGHAANGADPLALAQQALSAADDARLQAEATRRQAATTRAGSSGASVRAQRRAVVARYLAGLTASPKPGVQR